VSNASGVLIGATNAVNRKVTFKIWQNASSSLDSDLVYVEYQVLTIFEGEFSALVGQGLSVVGYEAKGPGGPPLALAFSNKDRYLGVTVDDGDANPNNDLEITPRQQMASTGYAFRARYAEGLASNGNGGTYDVGGILNLFDGGGKSRPGGIAPEYGGGLINFGTNDIRFGTPTWTDQGGFMRADYRTNEPLFNFVGRPAGSTSQAVPLMAIHANGNVGIGTNNPQSRLQLVGSFRQDPGNEFAIDVMGTIGGRLMVTPGGNVGIGNANPAVKLEVNGDTKVTGNLQVTGSLTYAQLGVAIKAAGNQGFSFTSGDTDGGLFSPVDGVVTILTNGVERLRVIDDNNNAVSINGALTAQGLKSNGGAAVRGGIGYVFGAFGDGDNDSGLFSPGDAVVSIKINNEDRLRIDGANGGNMWIGTPAGIGGNPRMDLRLRGRLQMFSDANNSRPGGISIEQIGGADRMINFGMNFNRFGDYVPGDQGGLFRIDTRNDNSLFQWMPRFPGQTADGALAMVLSKEGNLAAAGSVRASGAGGFTFQGDGDADGGVYSPGDGMVSIRTNNIERVRFTEGKVGINKTDPEYALDLIGAYRQNSQTNFAIDADNTYGGRLLVTTDGRVGIGNAAPEAALHVSAFRANGGFNLRAIVYDAAISLKNETAATINYGIISDHAVRTSQISIISDSRIKSLVGRSTGSADLSILQKIEVTDYTFKDTISYGARSQKKVIAQQLETVFPQAVSQSTEVVPDIFKNAEVADGWLKLETNLEVGDRVRLIDEHKREVHAVIEVQADRFRTAFKPSGDKVFVYGREVKDFRSVDYEAIAMLNVSATQEIKREKDAEVKALREQNAALGAEVAALRSQVSALAAQEKTRDAKLASIEKLLQSSQTVMARPATAKTAGTEE
jgi:hypothetical protein